MAKIKLTQLAVDRIAPPKAGRAEFFDTHLPGFGLRVSSSGHKAWFVFYRLNGVQRRYILGTMDMVPKVDQARDQARAVMLDAARGIDAAAVKAARKSAPAVAASPVDTVRSLAAEFIERHSKVKNRSWKNTERILALHVLSAWGERPVADIGRKDVHRLLDGVIDGAKARPMPVAGKATRPVGGPIAANHVLAAIRKMFNWAVMRGIITKSPVEGVQPPSPDNERDRVLIDGELARLYAAAKSEGGVAGGFIQALILTAQRRTEVATMRWADLDMEGRLWTLPKEATKAGREHVVPLSPQMVKLLTAMPRTGEYVFGTRGNRPLSGYSKLKAGIARLAGVGDWRLHDLRRTAATGMGEMDVPVSTISKILNHAEGGVTRKYNRHDYLEQKRAALDAWAARVEKLGQPKPAAAIAVPGAQWDEALADDNWVEWLERIA